MHGVFDLCFYIWLKLSMYWRIAIEGLVVCDSNLSEVSKYRNLCNNKQSNDQTCMDIIYDFMFCLPDNNVDYVHYSICQ